MSTETCIQNNTQKSCVICFEKFTTQRIAILEICGHIFCYKCLLDWSSKKEVCPICEKTCTQIHDYLKRMEECSVNWYRLVEHIPEHPSEYHEFVNEISDENKNSSMTEENEMELEETNDLNNAFDERFENLNSEGEMDDICDNMAMTSIVDFEFSDFN